MAYGGDSPPIPQKEVVEYKRLALFFFFQNRKEKKNENKEKFSNNQF